MPREGFVGARTYDRFVMPDKRLNARWLAYGRLFFVSYAPLSAIYAARLSPHWLWTVGFGGLAAWGVLDGWLLVNSAKDRPRYKTRITRVEDQGGAVAGYLATYLLPFLGTLPSGLGDAVAHVIYFGIAFVVFTRSDLALINPTLYLLGWTVHRVTADERPVLLLTRRGVRTGDVEVQRLLGDVLISR